MMLRSGSGTVIDLDDDEPSAPEPDATAPAGLAAPPPLPAAPRQLAPGDSAPATPRASLGAAACTETPTPKKAPRSPFEVAVAAPQEDAGRAETKRRRKAMPPPGLPAASGGGSSSSGAGAAARVWARPAGAELDLSRSVAFMLVTLEEYLEAPPRDFAPEFGGPAPIVDLHGATRDGRSVLLHVHGFLPHIYVRCPPSVPVEACRKALETVGKAGQAVVAGIEEVRRTPMMPYQAEDERMLRISLTSQRLVSPCARAIERGLHVGGAGMWKSPVFEANVPFGLRFLVDRGMSGGGWVEVSGGAYQLRARPSRRGSATLELDAHFSAVLARAPEGEWIGLAPLRLLALHLVEGEGSAILAAAAVLQVQGEEAPLHRAAWVLAPRPEAVERLPREAARGAAAGAEVVACATEAELVSRLREYVLGADPDVVTGYDLLNGHLSTLLSRAEAANLTKKNVFNLGRLPGVAMRVKDATFETKQLGKHATKDINVEGRLLIDLLTLLEREQKLSSYSLSSLALQFTGATRLELRATKLEQLAKERPEQLPDFALRDAGLCLRLFEKQHVLFRYVEMARVTGVPMEYLLTRGQSVKVFSMLLRKARAHGYVLPPPQNIPGAAEDSYEGGCVLEPSVGFYDEPIVTLDFASLYPSIMQRHNLCYSTMLAPGTPLPKEASGEPGFEVVPDLGHRFVTQRVRRGLVPMVLAELLAARSRAKKELKAATDPQTRAVLDGRQLALKVSANSVYGFTGMNRGTLPCQAIAASVTAYGRRMIERTKSVVEAEFCTARGYERDATVIYGDTDSVMISLGKGCDMATAFSFGKVAAERISQEFGDPIKMEFEKVYVPYLLMNKKRYAGLSWAQPEGPGKLDAKGIETVRRDWCQLVRELVDRSLQLLLKERSPEKAIAHVQETIAELRQGRVDPRRLVISKALVRDGAEAYSGKMVHVELAERLRKRNPALAPQVGERVPYVFILGAAGAPAYDKAEDPLWAMEQELPIDADYYIDHQLKQPLLRIFQPILGTGTSVEQRLFAGDKVRRQASAARGPLAAFARARAKCLGCRTVLSGSGSEPLCPACREPERTAEVVLRHLEEMRPLEEEAARLMTACAQCEGSLFGRLHLDCCNVDCPAFFRRLQVSRALGRVQTALGKLQIDW